MKIIRLFSFKFKISRAVNGIEYIYSGRSFSQSPTQVNPLLIWEEKY